MTSKIKTPKCQLASLSETNTDRIEDVLFQSFQPVFKKKSNIYQLFFGITKKLKKFFRLSKVILVIKSQADDNLKVIAIRSRRTTSEGLALSLPKKNSLLYHVYKKRMIYTIDIEEIHRANFIERKLLFDNRSHSIALCPIQTENESQGLLCLTSRDPYAFSTLKNGVLDNILSEFGRLLEKHLSRLHI